MNNDFFSLSSNAFGVLKASYASTRAEITELVEDAEFDEIYSLDQIQRAQQSLLAPVARLEQELGWLPELSSTQVDGISSALVENNPEAINKAIEFFPEMAKANVLAHLCGTALADDAVISKLVEAWDDVDEVHLLQFINAQRETAGFPKVERNQINGAIKALRASHARNAAHAVWTLDDPGKSMEALVEAELVRNSSSLILSGFVREYDNLSELYLVRISQAIDHSIEQASHANKDLASVIDEISELLRQWDDVNQPVQVFEQHQGHEEGRSKKIYEKLRALCLELANERGEFHHAKRLSEALLHTFPELESIAELLRVDVETLEDLDEQQKQFAVVEPLVQACESAKQQLPTLKSALQSSGFTQARRGILRQIFSAFEDVVKAPRTGDAAFLVVRDLALFINNKRNDPETAFRLIEGLITYHAAKPSVDVINKLDEERSVLHRNWKMAELDKHSGNLGAMAKTVDEMLKYAKGKDRTELQQLKSGIERKQTGKKVKWLIYGGIAAVIGFFVIRDELDKPTSRTSYQPTTTYQPSTQPQTSLAATEIRPPVGQGLALTRGQVRYCVFQGKRLEAMRSMTTTNYQINRFNTLIDDYNSRCSNYRYTSGVLSSVRREAQGKTAEFTADARRIVASW